uniref:Succinylglutamate desuccinylase/Aspartoacylase catalytic domain-containing protein n=1 Tax=Spongospora subterranea TaxID=70186 RepID=A0A0H5QGR0_9EUKA|eukprot:CRZ01160.1 hypothetical protein [Spongospora subterranea]
MLGGRSYGPSSARREPPVVPHDLLSQHLEQLTFSNRSEFRLQIIEGPSGEGIELPVIILQGKRKGPSLAVTAGIHGDEVTGVAAIFHFLDNLQVDDLNGTIIAIPVLNPYGFNRVQRAGENGKDLNRQFKARSLRDQEGLYTERLFNAFSVLKVTHHIDLHTATTFHDNCYYVRADLSVPEIAKMSQIMMPDIILNHSGPLNSLRMAMASDGIVAVTVEIGGPVKVDQQLARRTMSSLGLILEHLQMGGKVPIQFQSTTDPVVCSSSEWIRNIGGGLMEIFPQVNTFVSAGEPIARRRDIFGNILNIIGAPYDAVVIGTSVRLPIADGGRIVHLGKANTKEITDR